MSKLKMALSILAVICSVNSVYAAPPSQGQILQWLTNIEKSSANPAKNIRIEQTQKITLIHGEEAYLSGVNFQDAARNFWGGYILSRPKVQQSTILDFGGQSNRFKIHTTYYQEKPLDVIELENSSSGQGAIEGSKALVVIQGNQVKTLVEQQERFFGGFADDSGEEDCKTGHDEQVYFNVMPDTAMIVMTTVLGNGCDHKLPHQYKVDTKLMPIQF